ncbi:hypothetical protein EDC01DRAFT_679830 [Geopyxis carbonaria]|nr:hypothetical protein EDC01DRAFT_679830 [Geopyxis carbonaria]
MPILHKLCRIKTSGSFFLLTHGLRLWTPVFCHLVTTRLLCYLQVLQCVGTIPHSYLSSPAPSYIIHGRARCTSLPENNRPTSFIGAYPALDSCIL